MSNQDELANDKSDVRTQEPLALEAERSNFITNMNNGYYWSFEDNFTTAMADLNALFQTTIEAAVWAARIDELNTIWPRFTDIRFDGTNGSGDNPQARKIIDTRIKELKAKLHHNLKEKTDE